ncbi:MAG: 30S ribosomal protein S6 [Patescibacteria group bacterium UBA2163]
METKDNNTQAETEEFTDLSDLVAAEGENDVQQLYELGYHLLSTIPSEEVDAETNTVRDAVKAVAAEIVGEREPNLFDLAYTIDKKIEGKRRSFDTAYFGWIAFETTPGTLAALDEAMKANKNVLRYMIIKTTRDMVEGALADVRTDAGAVQPIAAEDDMEADEVDESGDTSSDEEKA